MATARVRLATMPRGRRRGVRSSMGSTGACVRVAVVTMGVLIWGGRGLLVKPIVDGGGVFTEPFDFFTNPVKFVEDTRQVVFFRRAERWLNHLGQSVFHCV